MSDKTNTQNVKKKYCLYQDVDVVISGYNDGGKCGCLKCKRKKCDQECKARKSERDRVDAAEFSKYARMCNECISATIYSEQQR